MLRSKWRAAALAAALTLVTVGLVPSAQGMAPATPDAGQGKKPTSSVSQEVKRQPAAIPEQPKGQTNLLPMGADGLPQTGGLTAQAGNIAALDFLTPWMGCYQNIVQTGIKNNTAATQYYRVDFYNGSELRTMYGSVSPSGYSYPTFYGVNGNGVSANWWAYLYVYSGGSYSYDEYKYGSHTCNVSVSFSNWGFGYVQLAIKNNGTAQASVSSAELAPTFTYGTYTGTHWDYPAPGGATLYRYYYVGTGVKYGIDADVLGAPSYVWRWGGTL